MPKLTVKMIGATVPVLIDVEESTTTVELKAIIEAKHGVAVNRIVASGACDGLASVCVPQCHVSRDVT